MESPYQIALHLFVSEASSLKKGLGGILGVGRAIALAALVCPLKLTRGMSLVLVALSATMTAASLMASESVMLADGGRALMPIYVSPEASPKVKELGGELAAYLEKITGAKFEIVSERSDSAILLGTRSCLPGLLPPLEETGRTSYPQRYRLSSANGSLAIVGEDDLAVQNAMFDFLHHVGYRQFFPTPVWEIIPKHAKLEVDIDKLCEPAFAYRNVFIALRRIPRELVAATDADETEEALADWRRKNRGESGYTLTTGHAYMAIIKRNAEAFRAHPEWSTRKETWAGTGSGHYEPKFIVDSPGLKELVCEDALKWLRDHPQEETYSIDPSDGRGWPKESVIGSPSDQTVYLANAVARAIRQEFPQKRVAIQAYNLHSPPPSLELEKGIIASIATKFNRSNPVSELMDGWRRKGAELGIRDYIAVWLGGYDLPGGSYTPSNPREYLRTIRRFAKGGALYYNAEMTSGPWATTGFGVYAGMRALWSPEEVDFESLFSDFLEKSFGKAKPPMHEYFGLIDSDAYPIVSEVLVGKMYHALDAALRLESDEAAQTRILQLVAYTHYVELINDFIKTQGDEKKEAYRALAQFAIRCRTMPTVPSSEVFSRRQPLMAIWDSISPIVSEVLKEKAPIFDNDGLRHLLAGRLESIQPTPFEPKAFSRDLRPSLIHHTAPARNFTFSRRQTLLWIVGEAGGTLSLKVRSRETLDPNQSIFLSLVDTQDPEGGASSTYEVKPDKEWHDVVLKAGDAGTYAIEVADLAGTCEIEWPKEAPVFIPSGEGKSTMVSNVYDAWFFVPSGVKVIGGYSEQASGKIVDIAGGVIFDFRQHRGAAYFSVSISPSEKGRFFKIEDATGKKLLMTVPPYLARRPSELGIPEECLPSQGIH